MGSSYEIVQVQFEDTQRYYEYAAPSDWNLRPGDVVSQRDMFSRAAVVKRTGGLWATGSLKRLDRIVRRGERRQKVELGTPDGLVTAELPEDYSIVVSKAGRPVVSYEAGPVPGSLL